MEKVIALIPARSGSKGVPDKNIRPLASRPLLAYSIAVACKSKLIERVIVSTDSEKYSSIARDFGAEVPFLRPKELAVDNSTAYEFIIHFLEWMRDNYKDVPEYLALLLPTTPLREVFHVDSAISSLMANSSASGLRSVHEMSETAYKTLEIEGQYLRCICDGSFNIDAANGPRQRYKTTYQPNGYIDVIRSEHVFAKKNIYGNRTIAYITPPAVEVDTIGDYQYLEYQVTRDAKIIEELFD